MEAVADDGQSWPRHRARRNPARRRCLRPGFPLEQPQPQDHQAPPRQASSRHDHDRPIATGSSATARTGRACLRDVERWEAVCRTNILLHGMMRDNPIRGRSSDNRDVSAMKMLISILLAWLFQLPLSAVAKERADLLLRHATIVDVAGARLIADQTIATRGDVIVAVGGDR